MCVRRRVVDAIQEVRGRIGRWFDERQHSLLSKHVPGRVFGVGHTVGECKQHVAGLHRAWPRNGNRCRAGCQSGPGSLEALLDAIRTDDDRGVVAAIDVVELTRSWIQYAKNVVANILASP